MSYDESSSFVVFRPPLLRKTNTGGGYLESPSGHCLGVSGGGSQLVLCDGEAMRAAITGRPGPKGCTCPGSCGTPGTRGTSDTRLLLPHSLKCHPRGTQRTDPHQ